MLHYLNTLFQVYPRITKMAPQPKQENRSTGDHKNDSQREQENTVQEY